MDRIEICKWTIFLITYVICSCFNLKKRLYFKTYLVISMMGITYKIVL